MRIRRLQKKDAKYMLEWMHDKNVIQYLEKDFSAKKIEDCITFIDNCNTDREVHLAIVNENDEYMGTVSLKNINRVEGYAEFAITVRTCAMGKGYSWFGMQEVLRIAFERIQLKSVYWCVRINNLRAIKFYNKNQFRQMNKVPVEIENMYSRNTMLWYCVNNERCNN